MASNKIPLNGLSIVDAHGSKLSERVSVCQVGALKQVVTKTPCQRREPPERVKQDLTDEQKQDRKAGRTEPDRKAAEARLPKRAAALALRLEFTLEGLF